MTPKTHPSDVPDEPRVFGQSEVNRLIADALFLRQYGERPPGAPIHPDTETWPEWERRAEDYLRSTFGQPPGESGSDPGRPVEVIGAPVGGGNRDHR